MPLVRATAALLPCNEVPAETLGSYIAKGAVVTAAASAPTADGVAIAIHMGSNMDATERSNDMENDGFKGVSAAIWETG